MMRERLKTVFFLIILFTVAIFVRLFFLKLNTASIVMEGNYYQNAVIGNEGIYRLQSFCFDEIYTKILSFSLLLFGNNEIAGVYLNIILQTMAVIILYFAIGLVANTYVAFLIAAVVALIPFYSDKVYEFSTFNLLILTYAIGLFILAIISKGVRMLVMKKKTVESEKINMPEIPEEPKGVITLDDIIGEKNILLNEETSEVKEPAKEEIVPPGMKEIILDDEEKKKKVKFIENPLPVPKRREHKEMDFAVELCDNNDDYDIKDVSGMDFFDIE